MYMYHSAYIEVKVNFRVAYALDNCNHSKYILTVSMNLPLREHLSSQAIPGIKTLADELAFFALHDSYQVGQMAYIRKAVGYPGLAG